MDEQRIREEERTAISNFYKLYRSMQEKYNLTMRSYFSMDVEKGFIKVWKLDSKAKKECICYVRDENEAECCKRAAEELRQYEKWKAGR